jgi:hypothetical protein
MPRPYVHMLKPNLGDSTFISLCEKPFCIGADFALTPVPLSRRAGEGVPRQRRG